MGTLDGRVVLVTRPAGDATGVAERLRELGAVAIEAPTIEILPIEETSKLDAAVESLGAGRFEWVVFTSPRAVSAVADRVAALGLAIPPGQGVAAIGPSTVERLRSIGVTADIVADPHTTAGLVRRFPPGEGEVLLPCVDIAPGDLQAALWDRGWTTDRVDAYRTRLLTRLPEDAAAALDAGAVDAVCFTSASTVRGFVTMAGVVSGPKVVCIGPATARAAEESGLGVDAVAEPHTIDGLVSAVERVLGGEPT